MQTSEIAFEQGNIAKQRTNNLQNRKNSEFFFLFLEKRAEQIIILA